MRWKLRAMLDNRYSETWHDSQEEAIAYRERMLAPSTVKVKGQYQTTYPNGYTAITRLVG